MNLELYRIFYVVAEMKNITRASEKLMISQPAVTKQIKNLEDYLGTPLFIRTKRGVILNEAGEKIFLKVKNALTLLDEVENEVSGFNEGSKGIIKIGISTTLTKKYLLSYIETYHKKYPKITFDISTYPTKDLIENLKNGQIDFIISKNPNKVDNDLSYKKLGSTNYIFITSNENKDLLNKEISIKELIKYPLLLQENNTNSRESVDKYFKDNNIEVEPSMSIGSSNLLIDFVKINMGIGYVTKLYVQDELKSGSIKEIKVKPEPEKVDFGLITLRKNIQPFHVKEFINMLK